MSNIKKSRGRPSQSQKAELDAVDDQDAAGKGSLDRSSLFIGSAEKVFRGLHAFDGPRRHMTLADIAHATKLGRSAAQRVVYTLEALGYIERIPDTRNYALSLKVLQFSYNYICANELIDKAAPYLLEISRSLGETTNLQQLDGSEIVFVARFPGRHLVNIDIVVGSRLPAVFTASGIAILSHYPEDEQIALLQQTSLKPLTPFTETNPEMLLEKIRLAGERGYAITTNQTVMGDISVAAAIRDEHGRAVAAINISVPTTRWTPEQAEAELAKHVQVAATSIMRMRGTPY